MENTAGSQGPGIYNSNDTTRDECVTVVAWMREKILCSEVLVELPMVSLSISNHIELNVRLQFKYSSRGSVGTCIFTAGGGVDIEPAPCESQVGCIVQCMWQAEKLLVVGTAKAQMKEK